MNKPSIRNFIHHPQQRPLLETLTKHLTKHHNHRRPIKRHYAISTSTPPPAAAAAASGAGFTSAADAPARLARIRRRHGPGLILLALIPSIAFGLGTWQVLRLNWKTALIAKFEDRLVRDPLPLPVHIDPDAISEFDYRRVYARGVWRHDLEMLVGPRTREGENGFLVVTPLERWDGRGGVARVLVCRGWIKKCFAEQRRRVAKGALPVGEVVVEGLLREPWRKNMFTPDNDPAEGEWLFPDVGQMAAFTGSQPVWVEATMVPDMVEAYDREDKGIPIGRPAEVHLRNTHAQYIFTWYSLSLATSIMFWMVIRKPASMIATKVRRSKEWA